MKTIKIGASHPYEVRIGPGLLDSLGLWARELCRGNTLCLVSDDRVYGLHGQRARESLEQAGFTVCTFVFPQGEQSKCGETFLKLLNFLARNRLTRTDALVALGGGVTGDLTGFAAACYLRGVDYLQVPTSLLAMVDSSVGGKTAIDLEQGKNLCGAFHQPVLVVCDTALLDTLPEKLYRDGCAEVLKYAILQGPALLDLDRESMIAASVDCKRSYVEADELDRGQRQFLNLGHTLGHAVEAGSQYRLSHGQSVAIGTAMIARAACKFGFCTPQVRDAIIRLLRSYGLPTETELSREVLLEAALEDKKRQGGTITLVVPVEIGKCILHQIPVEQLGDWVVEKC